MALAAVLAALVPGLAPVALVGGFLGGVLPDLDLYVGHRRTLHYPVYFAAGAVVAVPLALAVPTPATVALAAVVLGAGGHCLADVFGGGLELRPWEATADRAVYDHHNDRWLRARRWVRYDGAPEDLALSGTLAVGLFGVVDGPLRTVVAGTLAVAVGYAAVRRLLPAVAETLVARLPPTLRPHVPDRYRAGDAGDATDRLPSTRG
jgi:hypothetical protein